MVWLAGKACIEALVRGVFGGSLVVTARHVTTSVRLGSVDESDARVSAVDGASVCHLAV